MFHDPIFCVLFVTNCLLWGWAGYAFCQSTHKQKGIDTDPWEFLIPDHLPDEWMHSNPKGKHNGSLN